jgi:arginyl-tRNA synthetase
VTAVPPGAADADTLVERLRDALAAAGAALGAPEAVVPQLERPRDPAHGDWATNYALVLAKTLGRRPREIADALAAALDTGAAGVSGVEVAGPGFINFRLASGALAAGLPALIAAGDAFGRSDDGAGRAVNVEFVSANPTGPLHVGHGRQAALGDAIAALLEWTGWRVTREFYYNDAGAQIDRLTTSVLHRAREVLHARGDGDAPGPFPEDGYHGEYIRELGERFVAEGYPTHGLDRDAVRTFAVRALRHEQDLDLKAFGVRFDVYALESSLYADGNVDEVVRMLRESGHAYEEDGALWLRTTTFGDDKDRVMRKSAAKGGEYTYFVPDVAYHVTKWRRGFARAVDVQGADHHSTTTRVRAGLQAAGLGIPADYPEYVLHQMVTVMKGGEEVKISKRAGSYVTVRDLVDWVGRDAVRYFYLMRKGESQLEFDVDLARKQSDENPVYYVQMAHARVSGIFRVGAIDPATVTGAGVDLAVLDTPEERALVKALLDFPALVRGAAEALEPHRVATWLLETAQLVHTWYHKHHVLGEPPPVQAARLVLARAAQVALRNGLGLLGITAPERM